MSSRKPFNSWRVTSNARSRIALAAAMLLLTGAVACDDDDDDPITPSTPASIELISGGDQFVATGTAAADPFVFEVQDADGNAVSGIAVTFAAIDDGTVDPATATSGADGRVTATYTAGAGASGGGITATAAGVTTAATANATILASVAIDPAIGGDNQTAAAGADLTAPLVVLVLDGDGNPVEGVTVNWTTDSDGTLGSATSTTDAAGQASTTLTLSATAGVQHVIAEVAGLPTVSFTATGS